MRIYLSCILNMLMFQTVFGSHIDTALEVGQKILKPALAMGAFAASYTIMNRIQQSKPLCIAMPDYAQKLDLNELDQSVRTTLEKLKSDIESPTEGTVAGHMLILKGPAGSGKTTIAKKLPEYLGLNGLQVPCFGARYLPEEKIQAEIDRALQGDKKPILLFIDEIDSFEPNDSFWDELEKKHIVVVGTTNNEKRKLFTNKKVLNIDFLTPKLKEVIIANKMQELCINDHVTIELFSQALPAKMTAAELDMVFREIIKTHAGSPAKEITQQDCVRGIYNANTFLWKMKLRVSDMSDITLTALNSIEGITESQARELNEIIGALNALDCIPIQRAFYESFRKTIEESPPHLMEEFLDTVNNILINIRQKERESIISICNKIYQCDETPTKIARIYERIDSIRPQQINFDAKKKFFSHLMQMKKYLEDTMASLLTDYQKEFNERDKSSLLKREKIEKKPEPYGVKKYFSQKITGIRQSISLNIFSYLSLGNFIKVYNVWEKIPVTLVAINVYLLHKLGFLSFTKTV